MKFDLKNILIGTAIGIIGTTSFFLLIGDIDVQTDFQFGENLDQDDVDISISIEKNIENGEEIINVVATGRGLVTREDIEEELEKLYAEKGIEISSSNVNIEINIIK